MKQVLFILLATFSIRAQAIGIQVSLGVNSSGGGDSCENRIKQIRDDLGSWIAAGGASGLRLPQTISLKAYEGGMNEQIGKAKIKCVGPGDAGFPVQIQNTAKTCRFDQTLTSSQITCDFAKFNATADDEQYRLVHHEFAGLAGIEVPNQDDSNYQTSNQITGFLAQQIEKRLTVAPNPLTLPGPTEVSCQGPVNMDLRLNRVSNPFVDGLFASHLTLKASSTQGWTDPLGLQKLGLGLGNGDYIITVDVAEFNCGSAGSLPIPDFQCAQANEGDKITITNTTNGKTKTFFADYTEFDSFLQSTSGTTGTVTNEMITIDIPFDLTDAADGATAELKVSLPYGLTSCKTLPKK